MAAKKKEVLEKLLRLHLSFARRQPYNPYKGTYAEPFRIT
jgi:hypothetical protein